MKKKIRFRYTPKARVGILVVSIIALVLNYLFFFDVPEPEMNYAMLDFYESNPLLNSIREFTSEGLYWVFTLLPFVGLVIVAFYKPSAAVNDNPRRGFKRSRRLKDRDRKTN